MAGLQNGHSHIRHIKLEGIQNSVKERLSVTSDVSKIELVDAIIICVPTPLNKHREPDISYILNSMNSIQPFLKTGQLISLESTTYPGTSEEELLPKITDAGFVVGDNFFLVYSPEREDPGNSYFNTSNIPKVVGGQLMSV